jgi:hypothetical protein
MSGKRRSSGVRLVKMSVSFRGVAWQNNTSPVDVVNGGDSHRDATVYAPWQADVVVRPYAGLLARVLRYHYEMPGRECYHCKQWIEEGEAHDCWTTTEAALTQDLSEDLRDAWERLRETAVSFGDQRIYASHNSIMFSRKSCYFFVRPKRTFLELCIFLGRTVSAPQVRRVTPSSKSKIVHIIHIRHRDEVESPITAWLQEAFDLQDRLAAKTEQKRSRVRADPRVGPRKTLRSKPRRQPKRRRRA